MAGDNRQFLPRQITLDHVQIGATDGAAMDPNPHLAGSGLGDRRLDQLQRRGVNRRKWRSSIAFIVEGIGD